MKLETLALAAALAAAPAEARSLKADWKHVARADRRINKAFTVGMPFRDFEGLEKRLSEISDPSHEDYGKWLTKSEAEVFTKTAPETAAAARKWAESTGAKCQRLPEALRCRGSVEAVEQLFGKELHTYVHKSNGKRVVRFSEPATLPTELEGVVSIVTGLQNFPVPRLGSVRPVSVIDAMNKNRVGDPDYAIVPSTLENFYNLKITNGTVTNSPSTMAAVEFQAYSAYVQADLDAFAQSIGLATWDLPTSHVIGPFAPAEAAESALDVQYLYAVGNGLSEPWYWTESDWMFEFAGDLGTTPDAGLPKVLSISYAWAESDQCDISTAGPCESGTSYDFVAAVNQLFAKSAARGVSLIVASGDSGAHGRTDPSCSDPVTRPDFPAASPYVTSVGATEIAAGQTGNAPEPICSSGQITCATGGREIVASNEVLAMFSSGGGFSNVATRPKWQDAVVSKYLTNSTAVPPAGDFNSTGRGYPDVAALGHNVYIQLGGVSSVDGTSAATPMFSGMIANLNAWRLSKGKPVLGFVTPLLYTLYAQDPTNFNDVVQGDNSCTEDACPCPAATGFYAAPQWDAATGLGTPNFAKIMASIEKMGI